MSSGAWFKAADVIEFANMKLNAMEVKHRDDLKKWEDLRRKDKNAGEGCFHPQPVALELNRCYQSLLKLLALAMNTEEMASGSQVFVSADDAWLLLDHTERRVS